MENKKKEQKGAPVFYIALCLCVALIGLFGYFSGRSTEEAPEYAASSPSVEPDSEEVSAEFIAEEPLPTSEVYAELVTTAPLPTDTTEPEPTAEPVPAAVYDEEPVSEETPAPTENVEEIPTAVEVYAEDVTFSAPISGEVATGFSEELEYNQTLREWRSHNGVDITAELGAAVTAAADGTVESVSSDYLGTSVVVDHGGGWKIRYANISTELAAGGAVAAGDIVGTVAADAAEACTEPHLHLELWLDGKAVNPLDEIAF